MILFVNIHYSFTIPLPPYPPPLSHPLKSSKPHSHSEKNKNNICPPQIASWFVINRLNGIYNHLKILLPPLSHLFVSLPSLPNLSFLGKITYVHWQLDQHLGNRNRVSNIASSFRVVFPFFILVHYFVWKLEACLPTYLPTYPPTDLLVL